MTGCWTFRIVKRTFPEKSHVLQSPWSRTITFSTAGYLNPLENAGRERTPFCDIRLSDGKKFFCIEVFPVNTNLSVASLNFHPARLNTCWFYQKSFNAFFFARGPIVMYSTVSAPLSTVMQHSQTKFKYEKSPLLNRRDSLEIPAESETKLSRFAARTQVCFPAFDTASHSKATKHRIRLIHRLVTNFAARTLLRRVSDRVMQRVGLS